MRGALAAALVLIVATACGSAAGPATESSPAISAATALIPTPAPIASAPPTTSVIPSAAASARAPVSGPVRPIDTETHPGDPSIVASTLAATIAQELEAASVASVLLVPPPSDVLLDETQIRAAAAAEPGHIAFLGGGGTLNPIIQQTVKAGAVTAADRQRFADLAETISAGGAKGFGEMASLHFSFTPTQHYQEAPADHPLFLLLDEIAARHGMPINLHMEAVANDMPLPPASGKDRWTSLDPPRLKENVAALERLLDHDRTVTIVWEQTGWDHTGDKTIALLRRILQAHPNVVLALKDRPGIGLNAPLDRKGRLATDWRQLIEAFPDRFVIGSDTFFRGQGDEQQLGLHVRLVQQLSPDVARAVGLDNPIRIYHLGP